MGIGLFRSEFLFLGRDTLPSEDEQFEAYRQVVADMKGFPVTIRTMDLGADKNPKWSVHGVSDNPALGLCGIRLCLAEPQLFRSQLRALLRASIDKRDEKAITDAMDKVNASIDAKTKADEERKAQEEAAAAAAAQAQSTPAPQQYSYTPSGSASGPGSGPTGGGYHSSGGSAGSTGGSASPGWSVPANPDPSQLPGTDPSL